VSLGSLLITVAIAQNVILVHFLGPWPFPLLLTSTRRSMVFSGGITVALVWVALFYGTVYRHFLQPFDLEYLGTFVMLFVLAMSLLLWTRIVTAVWPFAGKAINRAMPVIFLNTTVFVVPMALAVEVDHFWYMLIASFAAGIGLFLALVPIAAVYERLHDAGLPRVLRGNVMILLATAIFALAIQQLDAVLAAAMHPIW
jgi:Na+-translocating ferredoxin:NAD+ oxidoreductase subunit A